MSDIPKDLLYTEEHEYVKPTDDADVVAIGITDYAQGELGDIVFIELPKVGAIVRQARRVRHRRSREGRVRALLAVSRRESSPSTTGSTKSRRSSTRSPYGDGWMIKVRLKDPNERKQLLDASAYSAHLGG